MNVICPNCGSEVDAQEIQTGHDAVNGQLIEGCDICVNRWITSKGWPTDTYFDGIAEALRESLDATVVDHFRNEDWDVFYDIGETEASGGLLSRTYGEGVQVQWNADEDDPESGRWQCGPLVGGRFPHQVPLSMPDVAEGPKRAAQLLLERLTNDSSEE